MKVKVLVSFWYNNRLYQPEDEIEIKPEDYEKLKSIVRIVEIEPQIQEDKVHSKTIKKGG